MLTWCAVALFAASAVTAGRWWPRRRDSLGRSRPFPVLSVAVLVLTGALALVPGVRHARLEHDLARAASTLVGAPVDVHCQTVGEALVDADGHLGFVAWGPDGRPEHRTTIKREQCDALAEFHGSPHARATEAEIEAVHVLSHESRHMAGVIDEAMAECQAMQRDAAAARALGADDAGARRLARYYWGVLYPRMPEGYRSAGCAPGGPWDEHLPDPPWGQPS